MGNVSVSVSVNFWRQLTDRLPTAENGSHDVHYYQKLYSFLNDFLHNLNLRVTWKCETKLCVGEMKLVFSS